MPNQPKTPNRVVRVDDALWRTAQLVASKNGETVSDVMRRALREYVENGRDQDSFSEAHDGGWR